MKKMVIIISVFVMLFCILTTFSPIYAADGGILDTIFHKGGEFFTKYHDNTTATDRANDFIDAFTEKGGIIDIIKFIGYLVFFIAGAVLGIKYMMSGVEGKTLAKNGLVSYSIGAILFYLADQVFTFFYNIFVRNISSATDYNRVTGNIWTTFSTIVNIVMVLIVVIYGLKYMWSSADDKANLKKGALPMIVGAILIMCTLQILTFIVHITEDTIGDDTTYKNTTQGNIVYNQEMDEKNICENIQIMNMYIS